MRQATLGTLAVTALLLAFIATPAQATGTEVSCTTGSFTVIEGVVTQGSTCSGVAVIPNGATSIGAFAFENATSLTSITIPNSVTSIREQAFINAASLTSIIIPDSVTSIGVGAFAYAASLTSITIPNGVTSISFSAFASATSLTSITIPNSVTSIGAYAFTNATSLTSITIPNGVTSIGDFAFYNATSLTNVRFLGDAPSVGDDAFIGVGGGAKALIEATATGFPAPGEIWNFLLVRPAPVSIQLVSSNYFVVEGFKRGAYKLSGSMKAFIKQEMASRQGESKAICTGTVRGKKWTEKREALAIARAEAGCSYINLLKPDLPVELKKRLIPKGKGNPLTVRIRVFY